MTAKSKIAPLKQLLILWLELSAAHLLAKLSKSYLRITRFAIPSAHLKISTFTSFDKNKNENLKRAENFWCYLALIHHF